jgi:hypothetical protein
MIGLGAENTVGSANPKNPNRASEVKIGSFA